MTLSSGSVNLIEQLAEDKKQAYSLYYQFITNMIKGYRIKSVGWRDTLGWSPEQRLPFSWNLGPAIWFAEVF